MKKTPALFFEDENLLVSVSDLSFTVWDSTKRKRIRRGPLPDSDKTHFLHQHNLWISHENQLTQLSIFGDKPHSICSVPKVFTDDKIKQVINLSFRKFVILQENNEGQVIFWDTDKNKSSLIECPGDDPVSCMALFEINPEDTEMAFACGKDIHLYNFENKEFKTVLEGHENDIIVMAVFRNNCWLLSGAEDGELRLWEYLSEVCLRTFDGLSADVNDLVICNDEYFLVQSGEKVFRYYVYNVDPLNSIREGKCDKVMASQSGMVVGYSNNTNQITFWN